MQMHLVRILVQTTMRMRAASMSEMSTTERLQRRFKLILHHVGPSIGLQFCWINSLAIPRAMHMLNSLSPRT